MLFGISYFLNFYFVTVTYRFATFFAMTILVWGDGRIYKYVVALRAVQTQDFMTAHWAHLPRELMGKVSNRIINLVDYDISGKPPATIEWE